MVKIEDISCILYPEEEVTLPMVARFLALGEVEKISYRDENHLGDLLSGLKAGEVPSKSVLVLKPFLGRHFQKCPCSRDVIGCGYRLLNTCFGCLYDCAYCFLNSYMNSYGITQFTNLDDLGDEIMEGLDLTSPLIYRIGTGEFTDSMMMDRVTGIATMLIEKFSSVENVMLEFKTKSADIDHLLAIPEKGNAVLAWSLNTPRNIRDYEEGAADLRERLAAAKKASEAGYFLAFHFDPVIVYENFLDDYHDVIEELFSSVDPERIAWISLGGFRYSPGFKEVIRERFPRERLTTAELFPGWDGKFRYLKRDRVTIYRSMNEKIVSMGGSPFVYLCMESADVWKQAMGKNYTESLELEAELSSHLKRYLL